MSRRVIIFVRDNNKEVNYSLMKFLEENLQTTTTCGNVINPKIIYKHQEQKFYNRYRIKELPASVFNKKIYIGIKEIKNLVASLCKKKNKLKEKTQQDLDVEELLKSQQEIMQLGPDGEDSDEEYANPGKFDQTIAQGLQQRQREQQIYGINPQQQDNSIDNMGGVDQNMDPNDLLPEVTDRPDNIESMEDISNAAHFDAGPDDLHMDAFLEKIGGATMDGAF